MFESPLIFLAVALGYLLGGSLVLALWGKMREEYGIGVIEDEVVCSFYFTAFLVFWGWPIPLLYLIPKYILYKLNFT